MAVFCFTLIFSALVYSIFLKISVGVDTLFPSQTIVIGQTLISQSQIFELGFFSENRYLGIWYKSTPDVVVWVANRENPINNTREVLLAVAENGTLAITSGGRIIWSAELSEPASNPVLQLLDNGNLVIVDKNRESSSEGSFIWQSFDYPTDTQLPGMKMVYDVDFDQHKYITSWKNSNDPSPGDFIMRIENEGLPEVVVWRKKMKWFRTGKWNGLYFSGGPRLPNPIFKPEFVFKQEKLISSSEIFDSSNLARFTLEASGTLQRYIMNARRNKWNPVYGNPLDPCDEYGQCGPNGMCKIDKTVRCECFKGFAPKFQEDWDRHDWSGGCARIKPLNCENGDGFLEVGGVKHPDMLQYWLNKSMSLKECQDECLRNCSCVAYANPYITNGGSGCLMWFGELVDTREYPRADSMHNMYIRLPESELNSSIDLEEKGKKKPIELIVISIAFGVLVSGLINGSILLMTKRKRRGRNNKDIELPLFKLATIVAATNNFSNENFIGEGGFGPVHKGRLLAEGEIAVKRLSRTSVQGLEEFKNEIILIAKLQHRNLVRLLGCCIEGEERMLIYEYMHNKSLDYFVFDQNRRTILAWPMRLDIIMGIARGLLYLHHDSRLKIIHRDLKTSNILLDGNLNPKISDFGLARIFEENQCIARTKRVVGTYGYMSPEYSIDGKFSMKSDIFSMGVVILEIVSGKKNRGFNHHDHYHGLLGHAWLLWKENRFLELMDECLNDTFVESQVKRCVQVGLLCVQKFAEDRPIMSSVLFMLGTDGAILPEPKEPGFFMERSSSTVRSSPSSSMMSQNNSMTITDLEAR
ncbi:Serine/threonine protein kinase [Handroanthus impetiginosus]|uniref:Receptor-like serine/threonine-protein kinase n=1 Tax=Handroanthus impetiginosus TaxID=429701 RepID=A0A2G9GFY4_9LAMI|nr:Serine/threonine protein kinase [Handroanthus impetiginosus]